MWPKPDETIIGSNLSNIVQRETMCYTEANKKICAKKMEAMGRPG